jgi:hypothetical protein
MDPSVMDIMGADQDVDADPGHSEMDLSRFSSVGTWWLNLVKKDSTFF